MPNDAYNTPGVVAGITNFPCTPETRRLLPGLIAFIASCIENPDALKKLKEAPQEVPDFIGDGYIKDYEAAEKYIEEHLDKINERCKALGFEYGPFGPDKEDADG